MLTRPATGMDQGPPEGFKEVLPPSPPLSLPSLLFLFCEAWREGVDSVWLMVSTGGYSPATRDLDRVPAAARRVR